MAGRWVNGTWGRRAAAAGLALGLAAGLALPAAPAGATAPDQASTSTRGVTASTINVVFPVSNLSQLSGTFGFGGDEEYNEQAKAIDLFVNQINDAGGIHGRRIHPIIANFDPTNDAQMHALCQQWTQGSPAAFAVLDGVGTYTGINELCVAAQGHTPMLSQWTTTANWTRMAAPYLWWTGPDQSSILQALVVWGLSSGRLGYGRKVAVVAGDRPSDHDALDDYLLPDLRRAGIDPLVETIAANPSETATTTSEAPLVIQHLREAHVDSVIPLVPFNVMFPLLEAETEQHYYPTLLLSDYEDTIQSSLALVAAPFKNALDGQEGVTTETLGGIDDDRPQSQGGYDPGVRSCWTAWHKAYPEIPPGNQNDFIEEQGPVQGWCQEIHLFARAAELAGRNLDRRTFVEAMSRIKDFPGGYSPLLTYGPHRYAGPSSYQVVALHDNSPPGPECKMPKDHIPQGECWVQVRGWQPLPSTG